MFESDPDDSGGAGALQEEHGLGLYNLQIFKQQCP